MVVCHRTRAIGAAAVEQHDLVMPVVLEKPVGEGGEPVVVVAIEHHGGVGADAGTGKQCFPLLLVGMSRAGRCCRSTCQFQPTEPGICPLS